MPKLTSEQVAASARVRELLEKLETVGARSEERSRGEFSVHPKQVCYPYAFGMLRSEVESIARELAVLVGVR